MVVVTHGKSLGKGNQSVASKVLSWISRGFVLTSSPSMFLMCPSDSGGAAPGDLFWEQGLCLFASF